jgi:hypothetical protein
VYSNSQFYITTHSTSPNITQWGAQGLNLSDIAATLTNPTPALKQAAVSQVANALSASALSGWYGKTFADKYPSVQQIAANIVDYISTDNTPTDSSPSATPSTDTSQPSYLGLKETPYLNQLAIANTFTITPNATLPPSGTLTISTTYQAQLWYMYTNSAGWGANAPWVEVMSVPSITLSGGLSQNVLLNTASITTGILSMTPSSYQLVPITFQPQSFSVPNVNVAISAAQNPGSFTAIFSSPQGRMDWAQVTVPSTNISLGSAGGSLTTAFQCTDPRVKPSLSANWAMISGSQLGSQTAPSLATLSAGTGSIIGDGDMSCHIFSANWPNTGTTGRQRGQIYPSELTYIHTGIPWRTFFLEPRPTAEVNAGSIPDWLAVDLFSTTDTTNVTGRMNINAPINNVSGSLPQRIVPLDALLGSSYMSAASSIYSYQVHNTPTVTAFAQPPLEVFTTAGQVCEVTGLADNIGQQKSTREAPAQAILNIITPRSNTFTIWCLAQSIKKLDKANPATFVNGTDVVTGEAKVQAIVERTVDTSAGLPGQVKFRTLYFRYLYN